MGSLLRKETKMRLLLLLVIFFAALTLSFGSPVPQRGRRPERGPPGRRPPPGRQPGGPQQNNNNGFTGPFGGNVGTAAVAGTAGFAGGLLAQPVANAVGGLFGK